MTRPRKCRRIAFIPGATYFKPAGIPLRFLDEVGLTLEEAEAIRLKDLEGLDQAACAEHMNVSRPTVQRIIESARKKMADVLLNGKAIRIEGGNVEFLPRRYVCENGHQWDVQLEQAAAEQQQICPVCSSPVVNIQQKRDLTWKQGRGRCHRERLNH